jgi:hypothetical protein
MDLFEKASRLKIRFQSNKMANMAVEDLWSLPLTSAVGNANLDQIAMDLNNQIKAQGEVVSFVNPSKKSDERLSIAFDIVKHIIGVRMEENKIAGEKAADAEKRQQIMALIQEKKNGQLRDLPIDELEKMLAK